MLFVSFIQWWYGEGWRRRARVIATHLDGTMDYFSFSLLTRTLFQPFRQIAAETVGGSIDAKLRAFADKLISRLIGAAVRLVIMAVGMVAIVVQIAVSGILLVGWAFVPFFPLIGLVLIFTRWTL